MACKVEGGVCVLKKVEGGVCVLKTDMEEMRLPGAVSPFNEVKPMRVLLRPLGIVVLVAWVWFPHLAHATTTSLTGTLANSTDVFETTLTLLAPASVTLQTYGFGGGTNAAGTLIPAGGTDPFLAIFAGTGPSATILTDALANPFGTSLDLTNYGSFAGCPPAGTVLIGGAATCGDITMQLPSLPAGSYTLVLSDGQDIANAVFDNGTLGEGFTDLTGGAFCNLVVNGVDCPNTSGNWALDITMSAATPAPVPEPGTLIFLMSGLLGLRWYRRTKTLE